MLQELRREGCDSWTPAGKPGEGVSLYFNCEDALAVHQVLAAKGIVLSQPRVGNGNWETFLTDPDGYLLAFVSPADAAENTGL
jgi:predicted enzyme related to lactoylglutathione lyase